MSYILDNCIFIDGGTTPHNLKKYLKKGWSLVWDWMWCIKDDWGGGGGFVGGGSHWWTVWCINDGLGVSCGEVWHI